MHSSSSSPTATEIIHSLALTMVPGVGPVAARQLVGYCGSAEAVFTMPKAHLHKIPGVGTTLTNGLNTAALVPVATQQYQAAMDQGLRVFLYGQADYPARLAACYDAPFVLFASGQMAALDAAHMVAIVGSRKSTAYGTEQTQAIVKALAPFGATVISGLAYGIDIAAHEAALAENVPTVAVLPGGIDKVYPQQHYRVTQQILVQGGTLLSEHVPGTKAEPHHFPARNRIIAGLADALVVVEAYAKGGALITAGLAFDYDREVLAVPGTIGRGASAGCNTLIASQKAQLLTHADQLPALLGWDAPPAAAKGQQSFDFEALEISEQEKAILRILEDRGPEMLIEEISSSCQIPLNQLANHLLQLELNGFIKALPGKKFRIKHKG